MPNNKTDITIKIKQLALEHGFTACGIAPAHRLEEDAQRLSNWLKTGLHASMQYMENHFDKRVDPAQLVPGTKSVIVLLKNYFPEKQLDPDQGFIISKYAYGRDYHKVIKKKLKLLLLDLSRQLTHISGRVFVDSAPVLERTWAALAGLGWVGKNANLISPKFGSFVFISEILVDIELDYDKTLPDYCGGCTKCIQACPTQAIIEPRVIDSNRCIPYWTIEHKGAISENLKGKFADRVFGCDICQDVCPWNRKIPVHDEPDFIPKPNLLEMVRNDWHNLTTEKFEMLFEGSAVKRTGFEGLMRNIKFINIDESTDTSL